MTNMLVPVRSEGMMFMPVMDMEVAVARRNYVVDFVKRIMVENVDFGKIPGAGDKPTLLKPGAEKLATFFGLTPIFTPIAVEEDWTGAEHKGEAFFYYRYRCELHRNGNLVASSEGSCNTWESKYRYRKAERVCPNCGQAAIIKGKAEYGGGWLCYKNKGGCGSKFAIGDAAIEKQEVGRIVNPDVADLVNTVQKMAQKRALIGSTLLAVNASEFFTQDIEDMVIDGDWTPVAESAQQTKTTQTRQPKPKAEPKPVDVDFGMGEPVNGNGKPVKDVDFGMGEPVDNPFDAPVDRPIASQSQLNKMHALGMEFHGSKDEWNAARPTWVKKSSHGDITSSKELTPKQADWIIASLEKRIAETKAESEAQTELQPA